MNSSQVEQYVKQHQELIRRMRWFRWNGEGFTQIRNYNPTSTEESLKFQLERGFTRMLYPYITYFTAPSEQDRQDVVDDAYEELRKYMKIEKVRQGQSRYSLNALGYSVSADTDYMIGDYERFKKMFQDIAHVVEIELTKQKLNL